MSEYWFLYLFSTSLFALLVYILVIKGTRSQLTVKEEGLNNQIVDNFPMAIAVTAKKGKIVWANQQFFLLTNNKANPGSDIKKVIPGYKPGINTYGNKILYIMTRKISSQNEEKSLLVCQDITDDIKQYKKDGDLLPVIVIAQIDNRTEVLKSMSEEAKPHLLGAIEKTLIEWVGSLDGFINLLGEGKYIIVITQWALKQAEKARFTVLDKIREIEAGNEMPLTISLGVGAGEDSINELGMYAQTSLDLALERGGDQVVIKSPERLRFYGGKSMTVEKRTKVKARVTANILRDMIGQSSQVIIMGHDLADYDSMGASLGLYKAVQDLGRKGIIIRDSYNSVVDRLLEQYTNSCDINFVKVGDASLRKIQAGTLLIVVDTHKPSLLPDRALLKAVDKIAVIDHHRRGEEFVEEASLVYLETYASSSSELVTEILQYLGDQVDIGKAAATALLAGITVDTKNFIYQTGVRTFEAAAYLRKLGADPTVVQKFLQDDLNTVVKKAEVMRNARILYGEISLGVSREPSPDAQLLAAKTADSMLNIAGVNGAFVLWPYEEKIAISARSNGKINVQVIMERLGGGGHLTVAAAQVPGPVEDIEANLLTVLEEVFLQKREV